MSTTLALRCCRAERPVESVLDELTHAVRRHGVVVHECGSCQGRNELRPMRGQLLEGYFYAAGTAHFAPMVAHAVPGLDASWQGQGVALELEGRTWWVGGP